MCSLVFLMSQNCPFSAKYKLLLLSQVCFFQSFAMFEEVLFKPWIQVFLSSELIFDVRCAPGRQETQFRMFFSLPRKDKSCIFSRSPLLPPKSNYQQSVFSLIKSNAIIFYLEFNEFYKLSSITSFLIYTVLSSGIFTSFNFVSIFAQTMVLFDVFSSLSKCKWQCNEGDHVRFLINSARKLRSIFWTTGWSTNIGQSTVFGTKSISTDLSFTSKTASCYFGPGFVWYWIKG